MYFESMAFISAMIVLRCALGLLIGVGNQALACFACDSNLQVQIADVHPDLIRMNVFTKAAGPTSGLACFCRVEALT